MTRRHPVAGLAVAEPVRNHRAAEPISRAVHQAVDQPVDERAQESVAERVDGAIERLLAHGRTRADLVGEDHRAVWDALESAVRGGKRFRPRLAVTAHRALGGTRPEAALQVGAAIELMHTAFVVHDDLIDGDDFRRGEPNVSGRFRMWARERGCSEAGASQLALAAGLLAGDLALAAAIRAVATCGAEPHLVDRVLDLFDEALHTTAAGELADVRLALRIHPVSLDSSLAMATDKTSAYSFTLPLQAGAVLAGADDHTVRSCARVGHHLGLAFQLVDDLIGVFADPDRSRKSVTSDLASRKQTPLLVHAAGTAHWRRIEPYLGRELSAEELIRVRTLLIESGSRQFVEDLVTEQIDHTQAVMAQVGLPAELTTVVTDGLTLLTGAGNPPR